MKLKTLIEVRECLALLRKAEQEYKPLAGADYVRCLSAQSVFNYELKQHMEVMPEIEIQGETA